MSGVQAIRVLDVDARDGLAQSLQLRLAVDEPRRPDQPKLEVCHRIAGAIHSAAAEGETSVSVMLRGQIVLGADEVDSERNLVLSADEIEVVSELVRIHVEKAGSAGSAANREVASGRELTENCGA